MPDRQSKIPTGKESQKGETFHTIQAGETLYKLTTMYNVSAKDICEANPGLSAENFRIGQVILIPQKKKSKLLLQLKRLPNRPPFKVLLFRNARICIR